MSASPDDRPAALAPVKNRFGQIFWRFSTGDRGLRDRRDGQPLPVDAFFGAITAGVAAYAASGWPARGAVWPSAARRSRLMARRSTPGERRALVRNALVESRLTPNAISMTGLLLNVVAAGARLAALLLPRGIAFSSLDHGHARRPLLPDERQGHAVRRLLDSSLDASRRRSCSPRWPATSRAPHGSPAMATAVAIGASLLVSYTRARAEALGVECKVGIATRAVRS